VLFGAPLLLLQNATTHAGSEATARDVPRHTDAVRGATKLDGVNLASHLVAYHAPATTTTTAPASAPSTTPPSAPAATPTTVSPPAPTPSPAPTPPPTTTTTAPPPPTTTTTTAPPRVVAANNEVGEATWYPAAAPGTCASPTLPFGTVVTVVNNATGASTSCTVDDREGAGYPRVVDLSPDGFSQIADLNEGVVDVTISW
jgi:rare lipoprotein A (peptidoglycan hydrolase)